LAERDEIEGLLNGQRGAWRAFLRRYAPVIYAAINKRLMPAGRVAEAEDVAQDIFVKICANDFRLLRGYDPSRARFTTWLTVIATSVTIDHLRRQSKPTTPIDDVPEVQLSVPGKEPAWIKIPEGLLSPRQALVLRLLYDRDLEVADVAKLLSVDPQTVRSMHHKALTRLRAHFVEDDGGSKAAGKRPAATQSLGRARDK
jgi:RNA polymerase sigma-70 factor (ECF subfamily)